MNVLPKSIKSSIAHYLFLPIIQNVNLFRGISRDLLFQLIIGKAVARESFGEISVLLGRPQPYAITTTEISQLLCLSRKTFQNILCDNQEDEQIIMRNHFQVCVQGYDHKLRFGGFDNVD
ncbi:hypothetical protein R3W88_004427 [Solanum pinnatisectum]|uniref:Cyclic nucleotide-binding domain-containing protein n=1 Tax=Solanum pinnatisectum TaxID=50273 RepID=A0AAV9K9F7_9SOLN|nr:hypothetical protein R3W88_004427 [Solanum pinnatisectum]